MFISKKRGIVNNSRLTKFLDRDEMGTHAKKSIAIGLLLTFGLSGCSVYMASNQPTAKNLDLLKEGTPRTVLIAEYGVPLETKAVAGSDKCEVFKFTQGYSSGAKATRAVFHGLADVVTLGLWEVIGTPTESVFSGDFMAYEVCYDQSERVKSVVLLNPPKETNQQPQDQAQ